MYKPSKPNKPSKSSKPSRMLQQPKYIYFRKQDKTPIYIRRFQPSTGLPYKKFTIPAFKIQDKTPVKALSYPKQSYNKTSVDVRNMLFELPEDIITLIYYFKHRDLMMNLFVGKNYNFALGIACTKIRYIYWDKDGEYIGLLQYKGCDSPIINIKPFDLNYLAPSCKCKGKTKKNKPCGIRVKYGIFCRFHNNKKTLFDF